MHDALEAFGTSGGATEVELCIAQLDAKVRAGVRRLNVRTQEELARRQANIAAIDELAELIDRG